MFILNENQNVTICTIIKVRAITNMRCLPKFVEGTASFPSQSEISQSQALHLVAVLTFYTKYRIQLKSFDMLPGYSNLIIQ